MEIEYISISKLINKSDSQFLRSLPKVVIRLIKRIVWEKELNRILNYYADYEGIAFLPKIIDEFNIKVEIIGKENLPENGKCFFVANHPFGFADGLILTSTVADKYGDFKAIGNDVFMLVPHLKPIIAAVNVFGTNSKKYLQELEKVFASDLPITHFPAGLVSRVEEGKIIDSVWQKSFITKAVEHKRNIVPIYFYGKNSRLFYFIYFMRKVLKIKAKLELVLLPHEMFNKKNKTIRIKIGSPIPFQSFDRTKTHFEWAQYVKQQVYTLKTN
ncbi:MAG TPA: 1-acyl-sn-glycerol-3-phosphate acyltransferase [Bacteroidales bacterium]|nr:1-acyl-sn-glycerol-3-phosphate acyltransferase [Bacteroidales bacterium]